MNITCARLDDLLCEGDAFSMQQAELHAQTCPACAEKLADWNDISATARSMRAEWKSDLLYPRIERSLKASRPRRSYVWQVAAAILLVTGIGAGTWLMHERSANRAYDQRILRMAAVDEVERAERAHVDAIDRLEKVAEPKLDGATSPLMVSYKEKLLLLDDAIAECQANIKENRQNAHLRKQLLAIYTEKQRTLQELVREENHAN